LSDAQYAGLAKAAQELCRVYDARLLLNRSGEPQTWADGVHLTRHQLMACTRRPQTTGWVGASCHDLTELSQAERLGLDYVLLSPVQRTTSHPDVKPLGWERFTQWVERVNLPVYALGGLGAESLQKAKQSGAQGIAAIGAFWQD
jgi:8-oxo-dGTP diphosphatase